MAKYVISSTELIALLARETGWTLEYIGALPLSKALVLMQEIRYQREVEEYRQLRGPALAIATWMNCMEGKGQHQIEDLIGREPSRPRTEGTMGTAGKPIEPKTITLADGKPYQLAPMSVNMMVEVEDKFEMPFGELFSGGKARPLRFMLWVMLKEYHPELTEEQVGKLVTYGVMADLKGVLMSQLKAK